MKNRPIGVFDSGLGGLTVVKEIVKLLPNENIIYFGDTARVPYGTRSPEVIKKFGYEDSRFLLKKKVKCVVIACNTVSSVASSFLKNSINIPIFEVITKASEFACSMTKNKKVGVIGTRATVLSLAYQKAIKKLDMSIQVFATPCPLFVSFIEEGEIKGELISKLSKKYLKDLKKHNTDTLILGCTHYPIIKQVISKEVGKKVKLINPGFAVATELKEYLKENKLTNYSKSPGKKEYYVTDLTDRFTRVAEMFLGEKIKDKIEKVELKK